MRFHTYCLSLGTVLVGFLVSVDFTQAAFITQKLSSGTFVNPGLVAVSLHSTGTPGSTGEGFGSPVLVREV